jgi:aspartate/methionine/tyrosine aminotransferase
MSIAAASTSGPTNIVRQGCTITQNNEKLIIGLALAANTQISALSTIFVTSLLTSPKLPSLIDLNSNRLSIAYQKLTSLFKNYDIPYIPCNAGLYVFARLAKDATSWDDESMLVTRMKEAGVLVSPGKAYHGPEHEKGWMRVGFAVKDEDLEKATKRMASVLETNTMRKNDEKPRETSNRLPPPIDMVRGGKKMKIDMKAWASSS